MKSRSSPNTSLVVARPWLWSALLLCAVASIASEVRSQSGLRRAAAERVLTPEFRLERAVLVKPTAVAGRVVLDSKKIGVPPSDVVATDLAGNSVPVKLVNGTVILDQAPGQWIVVKPKTRPTVAMAQGIHWLPGVTIMPPELGATEPSTISSYVHFSTVPIPWDTQVDAYSIQATVGLVKNGDPTLRGALDRKADVKLSFEAVTATVEPSDVAIERLGIEGEKELRLRFQRTDAPKSRLIVRTALSADGSFELAVQPRLDLVPRASPILGLGLEETEVSIDIVQAHGARIPLKSPVTATIQCTGARKQGNEEVKLSEDARPARFTVSSVWVGAARVMARAHTAEAEVVGSVTIVQSMPWGQLVAALAGGAAGGFARRFLPKARKRDTRKRVLEGLIVGPVGYITVAFGLGVLAMPKSIVVVLPGAVLVGVASGFLGVTLIEKLSTPKAA